MKNKALLLIIAVIVISAAAVAGWYYFAPHPEPVAVPAEFLPDDTLVTLRLTDLEKSIKTFQESRLGRKLKETDVIGVMKVLEAPQEAVAKYVEIKTAVESAINSILFKELFGQDVLLAVLPVKNDVLKEPQKALDSVLLIARTKRRAALVEFIGGLLSYEMEERTVTKYNGYTITSFQADKDINVFYTLCDGFLLAGFSLDTLKKSVDLKSDSTAALVNNPHYRTLSDQLVTENNSSFFFNNTDKMRADITTLMKAYNDTNQSPEDEKIFEQMLKQIDNLKGFNAIGYAAYNSANNNLQDKIRVLIDKTQLAPLYASTYNFKPEENRLLSMAPSKTLFCYWTDTIDLDTILKYYLQEAGVKDTEVESMKDAFKTQTGLAFDEVVQAFGNQYGVVLADIDTGGLFPIPELALAIQTENKDVVTELVTSLTRESPMGFKEETYMDVAIKSWNLPFGNMLQPSMAFLDDFCLLSVNLKLLKEMIRLDKEGGGLVNTQTFKDVNKGLTDANNSIMFVKSDILLDKLKASADWGANMMTLQDQQTAKKIETVLNKLIYPITDGLKMYQTIGSRIVFKEGVIEIDSNYQMEKMADRKDEPK
jgi:hypothetical protein